MSDTDKDMNAQIRDMTAKINVIYDSLVGSELVPKGVIKKQAEFEERLEVVEKYQDSQKTGTKVIAWLLSFVGITYLVEYLSKK